MSVQYPYRAVICGEEHIVQGWQGNKLITDLGMFSVGHIYGNWQLQAHRIFEVTTIQRDGKDGWMVNGKKLSLIETLRSGVRLTSIPKDENLRVYKKICAAAWIQTKDSDTITEMLDSIVKFWSIASQIKNEEKKDDYDWKVSFAMASSALLEMQTYPKVFAAWSNPIWLTEFHQIGKNLSLPPAETEKSKTIEQKAENSDKKFAEFNKDFSMAIIKDDSNKEHVVTVEVELRNLIKAIIDAGGHLPRTELRSGKFDNYQPEKLLKSKNAKLLVNFGLLGKEKSGRTTVFWAKQNNK